MLNIINNYTKINTANNIFKIIKKLLLKVNHQTMIIMNQYFRDLPVVRNHFQSNQIYSQNSVKQNINQNLSYLIKRHKRHNKNQYFRIDKRIKIHNH